MRRHALDLLTVLCLAVAARLPQILLSSMPLNIDSFAQVAIARDILEAGHWVLDETAANSYNLKMPVLPLLLATFSDLGGQDPLAMAVPLAIAVSLAGVAGIYVLAHALTGSRLVAIGSGVFLALLGPYIFVGSTLMKEAVALALLPGLVWSFTRRRDPRFRAMAVTILLLLPLIHHLSTLMAYGFVTLMLILENARSYWKGTWSGRSLAVDVLLGPALAPTALWYYTHVRMESFMEVWNPNEVALFLSVAFVMAATALFLTSDRRARPWFALSPSRRLPSLLDQKAVVILGAFLLVLANAYRPLFPGTVATSPLLLVSAIAYLPLAFLALVGLNLHRLSSGPSKAIPISLLLGPLTVILYALLRGLDPLSHVLLYRSVDFLDYGLAICVGSALLGRRRGRSVLAVIVLASLVATTPLVYATEETLQVQNTTYGYELAALETVSSAWDGQVASDQRLASVMSMLYGTSTDGSLPFKLADGSQPASGLMILEDEWLTRGAQVHPLPFTTVSEDSFHRLIEDNQLLYHGGEAGNALYVVQPRT